MPAVSKPIALAVALLIAVLSGAFYQPGSGDQDGALGTLPALPDWAHAKLPDFTTYQDAAEKKAAFFSFLYPRIVLANARVLIMRDKLEALHNKDQLSAKDKKWLNEQSERLQVDTKAGTAAMLKALDNKLDMVPPSLVLAQAANESAWGTSRFAVKGNNLFGQWCFSKGCGIVPSSRNKGATHEVASFGSPYQSIRAYVNNLNRHGPYDGLRKVRSQARKAGRFPDGVTLAQGLVSYSERGAAYVKEIRGMIRFNNLGYYDKQYQKLLSENPSSPGLLQLATSGRMELMPKSKSSEGSKKTNEG